MLDLLRSLTQKKMRFRPFWQTEIVDGDVVVVRFVGPMVPGAWDALCTFSSMIVGKGQGGMLPLTDDASLYTYGPGCWTYRTWKSGRWTDCLPPTGDIVTVDQDTKEISAASSKELENAGRITFKHHFYSRGVLGNSPHRIIRFAPWQTFNMDKSGKITQKQAIFGFCFFYFKSDLPSLTRWQSMHRVRNN